MQSRNGHLLLSPSDLNDYVECGHRTTLARQVALGRRAKPHVSDEGAKLLADKGMQHEADFLMRLHAEGRHVVEVSMENWDFDAAAVATNEAMRVGADVIFQATFVDGPWRGRADFLLKVEGDSKLGSWRYEPLDAKLARAEKPTYVLQLCFYSDGIAAIQGERPEHIHVLLGVGEQRAFRYDDFGAYYRRVRTRFQEAVDSAGDATEAHPVEACGLCEFHGVCRDAWRAEDSLVLVAGARRADIAALRAANLPTLQALALAPPATNVPDVATSTFATLRDQAALQLERRVSGGLPWRRIDSDAGRGFALLPRPSAGDIIFDIEGDPFWQPARGLHFLFGLLLRDGGEWKYRPMWAHDRTDERRMFEQFIDTVHSRLGADPRMHVYHYGTYENAAVKQLMGTYATREDQVDELLRRGVFVNLHTVVRQGLRAGVESYSLKQIEGLVPYVRRAEVREGIGAVLAYERWMEQHDPRELASIGEYNEDDCRATLALRDWLAEKHPDDAPWAEPREGTVEEEPAEDGERADLRRRLTEGEEPGSPRWLAGELLEYHRREARPAWWWFFERCEKMTDEELLEDSESIAGLEPTGEVVPDRNSLVHTLRFPPQQYKLKQDDSPTDPATKKSAGAIVAIDEGAGTLKLRRGRGSKNTALPRALVPGGPYNTKAQQDALRRVAASVLANDGRYRALVDMLARTPPRIAGWMPGCSVQTTDLRVQRALATGLDSSYLFIQGPPGTGKTWTGARLITELMRHGRRVGVTATSHKAIHNLLAEVVRAAKQEGLVFRGVKKVTKDKRETYFDGDFIDNVEDTDDVAEAGPDVLLFAGTAWLFAHEALDAKVDTLVIDEAGQVSLADALAMGTAARNVVLLGDPLQLAQVSQGTHPDGTGRSVLEHFLGDSLTIPPDKGVFLQYTRRMHPDVCRFVSEIVYDNRLQGIPELAQQATTFGTGLRFKPVDHAGNAASSSEEAAAVAAEVASMMGGAWMDRAGLAHTLGESDFMVVAPYNAQVRKLRNALDRAGLTQVPVGTVDKFQGREAPIVLYSMATSSTDDVPRSLEFLFSRNRLNVAVSRAMCLAMIVASPRLLESRARTIEQMRLINALCRFVEMAKEQTAPTA